MDPQTDALNFIEDVDVSGTTRVWPADRAYSPTLGGLSPVCLTPEPGSEPTPPTLCQAGHLGQMSECMGQLLFPRTLTEAGSRSCVCLRDGSGVGDQLGGREADKNGSLLTLSC